ncbi:MAG: ATP-binding cassette domain-containing protein [Pseudomonadota bacterium]
MIHVEHLRKNFGKVRAADDISFDVAKGEVVGLLGPNGAGKTTTMRIITGFLPADDGLVTIDGKEVVRNGLETRALIGYLPENAPLYTDMEVTEYLKYIGSLRGIKSKEMKERIFEMVETCGLASVAGRTIGELSKGFRQRVGLGAAMIHHPPVLILDEPTTGLDPNQINEIRNLIKQIGKHRTVMLSTHILQEVQATCSRAIIINRGKVVAKGTLDELKKRSSGKSSYTVSVRGSKEEIAGKLEGLGLTVDSWLSNETDHVQRVNLAGDGGADHSEDIFNWAVTHNLTLSELKRETATLEDVFRDLTHNKTDEASASSI